MHCEDQTTSIRVTMPKYLDSGFNAQKYGQCCDNGTRQAIGAFNGPTIDTIEAATLVLRVLEDIHQTMLRSAPYPITRHVFGISFGDYSKCVVDFGKINPPIFRDYVEESKSGRVSRDAFCHQLVTTASGILSRSCPINTRGMCQKRRP
jgi:hypothetical protein